jgi:uncharacterized protein YdaU (DUF1376 family)
MNFYKHYIGDFQRDTGHLSLTERGAYLALIHHYYATEIPLPKSQDALFRIAGAVTKVERDAVKNVLSFFEPMESGLVHSRIEAELQKAGEISNTNRNIALAREASRRAKKDAQNVPRNDNEQSTNRAQNVPRNDNEQGTNQTPDTRHQSPEEEYLDTHNNLITSPEITPGSVCVELTRLGIMQVNPMHPELLEAIANGAIMQDFCFAATESMQKGKGFAYLIAIVKNRIQENRGNNAGNNKNNNETRTGFGGKPCLTDAAMQSIERIEARERQDQQLAERVVN